MSQPVTKPDSAARQVGIGVTTGVITAIVIAVGSLVLAWTTGNISIPVWLLALIIAVAVGCLVIAQRLQGRVGEESRTAAQLMQTIAEREEAIAEQGREIQRQRDAGHRLRVEIAELIDLGRRVEANSQMLADYLDHVNELAKTVKGLEDGELGEVTLHEFIEHGVLERLQDVLQQDQGEEIRVSILRPASDDPECFVMPHAIGHTLPGRRDYRMRIDDTLAGVAYRTRRVKTSNDVANDPDFIRNPRAKRDFASMVAVPLVVQGDAVGVLSVVSTIKDAFPEIDLQYLEAVGIIVAVAWGLPGWQYSPSQD